LKKKHKEKYLGKQLVFDRNEELSKYLKSKFSLIFPNPKNTKPNMKFKAQKHF